MHMTLLILQSRRYELDGVSNHRRLDCLLNRLFRRRSKETSASLPFVRGIHRWPVDSPHKGQRPVTGGFPSQRADKAEFVFIWWRHHDNGVIHTHGGVKSTFTQGKVVTAVFHTSLYWMFSLRLSIVRTLVAALGQKRLNNIPEVELECSGSAA